MMSGLALLQGKFATNRVGPKVRQEAMEKDDISFTPMAMPMLSGPGSISLLIGYYSQYPDLSQRLTISAAIIAMAVIIYVILRTSPYLFKLLGVGGLKAIARIMGFIVIAISVEYIISEDYRSTVISPVRLFMTPCSTYSIVYTYTPGFTAELPKLPSHTVCEPGPDHPGSN